MTAESGLRFASVLSRIDFSEPSTRALQYAMALAGCKGGCATLMHVAHPLLVEAAAVTYDATFVKHDADRELRSVASTALANLRGDAAPETDIFVCVGDPASEIDPAVCQRPPLDLSHMQPSNRPVPR